MLFCVKMGYRVAVLGRGEEKRKLAHELGAHIYVNMQNKEDPAFKTIADLGGISVVASTGIICYLFALYLCYLFYNFV